MADTEFDDDGQDPSEQDDDSGELTQVTDTEREKLIEKWYWDEVVGWNSAAGWAKTIGSKQPATIEEIWQWNHKPITSRLTDRPGNCTIYLEVKDGERTKKVLANLFARPDFAPYKKQWEERQKNADRLLRKLRRLDTVHVSHTLDEPDDGDNSEPRYVLDKIIPAGEISILYGEPKKAAKSSFGHKLALCVASDDMDFDGIPVPHGRVLYVSLDAGADWKAVKRRMVKVCDRLGIKPNSNLRVVTGQMFLDREESVADLLDKYPGEYVLVVIDSLYMALSGHDPTNAGQVNAAFDNIKTLIEETGAAVVIVSHTTRGDSTRPYGTVFQDAGASSLIQMAADAKDENKIRLDVRFLKNDAAPESPTIFHRDGEYLAPWESGTDVADKVTHVEMWKLMPTADAPLTISVAGLRVKDLLIGKTPGAQRQEWLRIRTAWKKAGVVRIKDGKIWRVP